MLYRRTSLVSGLQNHGRASTQHKYEATVVTPSGAHLAQPNSFSLSERPTTAPLVRRNHSSPTLGFNLELHDQSLPPGTTSTYQSSYKHDRHNNALPEHVRSYVQELRRKRRDFDAQRNTLILQNKTLRRTVPVSSSPSNNDIHTASAIPLPRAPNERRAEAQRRVLERSARYPTSQNIADQLKEANAMLQDKNKLIQHMEQELKRHHNTTLTLQLRIHELETNHSTLQRQTSVHFIDKDKQISGLHQEMSTIVAGSNVQQNEYKRTISQLQQRCDSLQVQLLSLKTSPISSDVQPNSWVRSIEDVKKDTQQMNQQDQTQLVVHLKLAVEALELRNFELRNELERSRFAVHTH